MKPTKNRIFCRECGRAKMLFESEKKAMNFIKFNSEEFDSKTPNRAYYCEVCGGWHVTSREGQSYINPLVENTINQYNQMKGYRKCRYGNSLKIKNKLNPYLKY